MKKIIVIMALFMFASVNAYSMEQCNCPCGYRDMGVTDYLKVPAVMAGMLASPAYMNYMLFKDGNMNLLYVYDSLLFSSAAVALVSGDAFDGRAMETSRDIMFFTATVPAWGYSCVLMINGILQKDTEKTGRGALGLTAGPAAFLAAYILTQDCRCRPESECLAFKPVISREYAGLNCSLRF